ncbi:MAG: signal recognition particle-docking protein FtsY [Oligosphaeraceae bacterium]|nr:signal recognition particle-docking protein FtsY [Oligosphaeraceae bacterium]
MLSILSIFKSGLQKTKTTLVRSIQGLFSEVKQWDEQSYAKLEAALVGTDLGAGVSARIIADLRERYQRGLIATGEDIIAVTRANIQTMLLQGRQPGISRNPDGPTVILFVGVNGSGKTTSVAKLAHFFQEQGQSVLLGAADTFRAAGVTQLELWGERLNCPVVGGKQGGDSAAVAFDAIKAGIQRRADYVIIDTAGRQHTRKDLMAELSKVKRIVEKALPGAPHETWLTVDASIGSNALVQAREFGKIFPITGLVLTKLDGTGRGGVVVAIKDELGHPVQFVGLGEQLGDLQVFDPEMFVQALFD